MLALGRGLGRLERLLVTSRMVRTRRCRGDTRNRRRRDAEITYQAADGTWRNEHALGGDRPETAVVDDG
nr:hypothetical protein [Mycoplana azooxidifex]